MTPQTDEGPLVDDIAARIRARIMNGELAIGKPLRQAALAAEFGVSRTPVREALRQLQSGGLIEVQPNRGAVVRVPTPWEVRQAYEVRAELEGLAARRAASRITGRQLTALREHNAVLREAAERAAGEEAAAGSPATTAANDCFHTVVCEAADNPWLSRMIDRINESFPRNVSSLALAGDERHRQLNIRQHELIVEALTARDADRAQEVMRDHVISSGELLTAWYERRSQTVFHG
ncbi:transcriptional regulator, GntR family protein [Streptomyces bingchenggensis BCW-1]|uniref:Transcriptional regulator, GntR family protein n=1 Tax=Streptomyces bingchenggensis (strain BCW-1) TaxID=749414 RepID=D7CDN0_STRBB|nr:MULTISPECIES: GntR family transcriptional regulator [Streptomyces]ADI04545.1 transcriptional regulator, GntR family protein [Streptomyces bingchenggensis BCW-1]